MGIFDDFKQGVKEIRKHVETFKSEHKMISSTVSEVINSFPSPFDAFGRIFWDGLEKKDESAEILLETLEKLAKNDELHFMEITINLKKLMEKCQLSAYALAQISMSDGSYIHRVLKGERNPSREWVFKISVALRDYSPVITDRDVQLLIKPSGFPQPHSL